MSLPHICKKDLYSLVVLIAPSNTLIHVWNIDGDKLSILLCLIYAENA